MSDPWRHFSHICQVTFLCLVMALSQAGFKTSKNSGRDQREGWCSAGITRVPTERWLRLRLVGSLQHTVPSVFPRPEHKLSVREEIVLAHWCQN